LINFAVQPDASRVFPPPDEIPQPKNVREQILRFAGKKRQAIRPRSRPNFSLRQNVFLEGTKCKISGEQLGKIRYKNMKEDNYYISEKAFSEVILPSLFSHLIIF